MRRDGILVSIDKVGCTLNRKNFMQIEGTHSRMRFPDPVHVVEFYPSLDDYIYVSTKLTASIPSKPITTYAYYAFLLLNTIVFPAFLWLNGYFVGGLFVFIVNMVAVAVLVPRVNSDAMRRYYAILFGKREERIARVELSNDGILYSANDSYMFWGWETIEYVEETEDSLFVFSEGNGIGIRKNGFAYQDEQRQFLDFAKSHAREAAGNQLSA